MARIIDLEGVDGAGKGTQARKLVERLRQAGLSSGLVSFPRYRETLFGRAIGEFLNGRFGSLEQVHPFLVSLLFAGDRLESRDYLLGQLAESDVLVCDRYVPSNMAHQGAKLDGSLQSELMAQIEVIEYEIHGLPRPDLVVLLDLPIEISRSLVLQKAPRNYTDQAADLQEADEIYLRRVQQVYRELASTRENWRIIDCCEQGELLSVKAVSDRVWNAVAPLLGGGATLP